MVFPIGSSLSAFSALRNLGAAGTEFTTATRRLSTGRRINSAADDAAGLAILQHMGAQVRGIRQAVANVEFGVSLVQTTDSAISQSQDAMQRIRELAVQAANGTLTTEDRAAIATEQQALAAQIGSNVAGASLNGTNLLTATQATVVQTGPNVGDAVAVAAQGPQIAAAQAQLSTALASFTATPNTTTAQQVITAVDSASQSFSTTQAALGATQNRFESTLNNLRTAESSLEFSRSRIEDADIAAEVTRASASRIRTNMALAVLAQGRVAPELALRFLR